KFRFLRERAAKLHLRLKRKLLWKKNEFTIQYHKATGKELPVDIQRNHKAINKALVTYNPPSMDNNVLLFRALNQPKAIEHIRDLGWQTFTTGKITVIEVNGSHGALTVYPFAEDLAKAFGPFIEKEKDSIEIHKTAAA